MSNTSGRTRMNRPKINYRNRLKHACDAGILSTGTVSDCEDSDQMEIGESHPMMANMAASLRVFSESIARTELAEMEMIKAREASRCEAERRRMEVEADLYRTILQTQLQIASLFAVERSPSRKRRRVEGDGDDSPMPPVAIREGTLLLSLLQSTIWL